MKKIQEAPKLLTGPVQLYLDDIISIVGLMREQETDNNGNTVIVVGGYELESIEELANFKPKEHSEITITHRLIHNVSQSTFNLSVDKKYTSLSYWGSDISPIIMGVYTNIERVINSKRRKLSWARWAYYFLPSIAFLVSGLSVAVHRTKNLSLLLLDIILIMAALALLMVNILGKYFIYSRIILIEKVNHDTFWKRNKDKILVGLILNIVTFLLGLLTGWLMWSLDK